jgi:hypothetical protein
VVRAEPPSSENGKHGKKAAGVPIKRDPASP